jgi:transmembrane sensor
MLADGRMVALDSVVNGSLAVQGNVNVVKKADGEIEYRQEDALRQARDNMVYNILYNPRGSKVINLTLGDGTKVWLNAESSLKYPVVFAKNERKVEITGEAYFEVSKDPLRKFTVDANGIKTEVLGTHFNVNSYADANDVKVTLLEGSVRVTADNGRQAAIIKPGEQAKVLRQTRDDEPTHVDIDNNVDVEMVMAWKNGLFNFSDADVKEIMQQAARWYDVDVVYSGTISNEKYKGKISRTTNLSELMKILEINGVKWRLEGRKIVVGR